MGILDLFRRKKGPLGPRAAPAPRKGMTTQCVCVLLDGAPPIAAVEACLADFNIARAAVSAPGADGWALGGPGFILPFRPDVNGYARVDVVDRPWPDHMGSATGPDAPIFAAWALGHFGPCTYPGNLARAVQHAYAWREGRTVAPAHAAFLRVRTSYVFGSGPDALLRPDDYDALAELRFVNDVAVALGGLPGALAVFNPGGELLLPAAELKSIRDRERAGGALGVDGWSNVRLFKPQLSGIAPWLLFDSVGMGQVDVQDHEGSVPADGFDSDVVPGLLRSMSAYDCERRGVLGPGDTATDLNGKAWRARAEGDALIGPPRPVLRWFPNKHEIPPALLGSKASA